MAASILNPISLPLPFFSIKTPNFPNPICHISQYTHLPSQRSSFSRQQPNQTNSNPQMGSPPEPITIHPHLHHLHHWSTDPPSLHRLCTQTNVQMHSLALFLEFVFKFDIFFAAAGKWSQKISLMGVMEELGRKNRVFSS
ncbi:hypothetical protein EV1_039938 [Malus domestica]